MTDAGRYFVSSPSLTIIGKPSAALSAKIESDEKERIEKRKSELGEEKLKELETKLEQAKKESDVPPPPEMIGNFPVTDVCDLSKTFVTPCADKLSPPVLFGSQSRLPSTMSTARLGRATTVLYRSTSMPTVFSYRIKLIFPMFK